MEDTRQLKEAFDAAHEFLNPVLQRDEILRSRGESLLEILGQNVPEGDPQNGLLRANVVERALSLLLGIHRAFVEPVSTDQGDVINRGQGQEETLVEDAKRRRALHALLDLLVFEGIYPSLSEGVGIPLEQRMISVLPKGVVAQQPSMLPGPREEREHLLRRILEALLSVLRDKRESIQPIIRGRILSDIICATAELSFNSRHMPEEHIDAYKDTYYELLDETSTPELLPILSSFLQASSAEWFKSQISSRLSRVPLRPDGVFQTILFIASQFAPSLGHAAENSTANAGPPITVQAIMQISRLLSSVPQEMSADEYFSSIAPKFLSLLDGEDPDLKKTSSYVIGNGILSKKAYGAPGSVGYSIFVLPIFEALTANLSDSSILWLQHFNPDGSVAERQIPSSSESDLVNESKLRLALDRLSTLALSHPNPGLLKRLVTPVLLSLWGLQCYATEHDKQDWKDKPTALMQTFFSVSAPVTRYQKLVDHVLWDGGTYWAYAPAENGGISLKKRSDTEQEQIDLIRTIDVLGGRVDRFLELLAVDPQREDMTGDIFLYVSRQWLLGGPGEPAETDIQTSENGTNLQSAMQRLISAKFAEKLLDLFKDTLSRRPLKVLEVIHQLFDSELNRESRGGKDALGLDQPSIQSIANIATREEARHGDDSDQSSESLAAAFSLLSAILTSPDFTMSQELSPALQELKTKLDALTSRIPSHLVQPSTTASMLLDITLSDSMTPESKPTPTDVSSHVSDLQTHRQALNSISSSVPPVQAEGLSLLSGLITKSSPVLDIPSTLLLLVSLITTNDESAADDEFLYLNVIKVIGLLASRHPRSVVKTLAERYADRGEEATVDQRLKIGEALLKTVQELNDALVGEAAKVLGETMVAIAGRRETKPKARKERDQRSQQPVQEMPPEELEVEDDSETEDPAQTAYSRNILEAWAAGAAADESPDDLRVRSSAMSVLASAIQTNLAGMGQPTAAAAVELALSTLTLEPGSESAILRRAAVVLLLDLVKAFDTARENGSDPGFGFSFTAKPPGGGGPSTSSGSTTVGNVPEILRVVKFVQSKETDTIVRGHIQVLVENLENWTENYLLWGIRDHRRRDEGPNIELGDQLAGLNVQPLSTGKSPSGPRIQEIE